MTSGISRQPLISIILPTLNCAHIIDKALTSILTQTFRDFEVILADGGSADGTLNHAIQHLASAGVTVRAIISAGAGIYASMNEALQLARGDWVYFIGSDDRLMADDTLEQISGHLIKASQHVVHGDIWVERPGYVFGGAFPLSRLMLKNFSHQAAFYRLQTFRRHGLRLNEKYRIYADWDMNLRLSALGPFLYVPQVIASFGCDGLSANHSDALFMADKEANVIDYYGWRAFLLLSLDRLALGCRCRPHPLKSSLFLISRIVRSPLHRLRRTMAGGQGRSAG